MLQLTKALCLATLVVLIAPLQAFGHSWFPDDGCRPGLSADGYFYAGGPAQYWSVLSGGWNNCHLETATTANIEVNFAEWYLPIAGQYDHADYSVEAYISGAGGTKTTKANYFGWANGHAGGVTFSVALNQRANQGGLCYIIGNTTMNGSNGGLMEISDLNGLADGNIYVDIFCFRRD